MKKGIDKVPEEGLADDFQDQIAPVIQEKYTTAGTLVSIGNRTKTFSIWKALNIIWICRPIFIPKVKGL